MELSDLFLTPLYLGIFYAVAFGIRARVTNQFTKQFFIPALTLKFVGAIALGLIYQFYYNGGDTYNYFFHTKIIYSAFGDSFSTGLKLLLDNGDSTDPATARYVAQMYWHQPHSTEYATVRVAAFFGFFCFNNYSVIALFFAATSFSGLWAMYVTFVKIRPHVYKQLAWVIFYIPSMFFWGSGLMKDALAMGALGWLFYALYRGAIQKRGIPQAAAVGFLAAYALLSIKVYILLCFLPGALLWVFNENNALIKNQTVRVLAKPVFFVVGGLIAVFAATNLTKGDDKYDVDKIGERSKITADYLYETSVAQNGSAYSLGTQDGTIGGMVKLAPQAIATALFRPMIFEARNPIMLLSAIEAGFFLIFTLRIFWRTGVVATIKFVATTPVLVMCFVFSLIFAASVAINSSNFGTLVRYKIPMIPFYLGGLYILQSMLDAQKAKRRQPAARRRVAA
ncbi:hypothetical protein [Hymenobacter coccineus]|uniref:Glycosyltransferase RgtA/B/C/D-like domain-containing protein n=1 Tax=Hymenobacter coccineus TaxID=1908235 RepID=A0A1G1TJQ9_9BACT|nr:hypothetical protein [Hymenobacter coccineus]OGX91097.1 hypothetical protein BEN49_05500 [Hymenobacter coccineus]